jgi:hypothetical protein
MNILRADLIDVAQVWNTHRIRPSHAFRCPPGIPDQLFFSPVLPAIDCLYRVNVQMPAEVQQHIVEPTVCVDDDFSSYLMYLRQTHGWTVPTTVVEATVLYENLLRVMEV